MGAAKKGRHMRHVVRWLRQSSIVNYNLTVVGEDDFLSR
jgi:hypothetical protein